MILMFSQKAMGVVTASSLLSEGFDLLRMQLSPAALLRCKGQISVMELLAYIYW